MTGTVAAILVGALIGAGVWSLASAWVPAHPRLADALQRLDGDPALAAAASGGEGIDRLGAWLRGRWRGGVSTDTLRRLQMRGVSVERHLAHKLLGALVGLLLPLPFLAVIAAVTGVGIALPAGAGVVGAVLGFLVPDLLLRQGDRTVTADATEALLTFFDLVILERLANQSGTQALRSAAALSEVTVFASIRDALERARLEQRAPYAELQRLGRSLELPALVDLADVMKLDESGAALSGTLRARVRELRDAHLTRSKIEASAVSERMAFFMVVPSLVFGLIFLVPPILRLLAG